MIPFNLDHAIDILQRTPATLRTLLQDLNEEWVHADYGANTFSPFDVVGHLIHGEKTDWMPRMRMILKHGDAKPFEPFDRHAMYEASKGKSMAQLLDDFEHLRRANVGALRLTRLEVDQLALPGLHPALGPVTLKNLLATWVAHDLHHIAQICKAMARQYRDEVGPWREYISILG